MILGLEYRYGCVDYVDYVDNVDQGYLDCGYKYVDIYVDIYMWNMDYGYEYGYVNYVDYVIYVDYGYADYG